MALFAHTIVSRLSGPVETVQAEAEIAKLSGVDESVETGEHECSRALTDLELDAAWRNERAFGPNAHHAPIDFVPARLHFDDFGQLLNPSAVSSVQTKSGESGKSVSSWYKSLTRTSTPTTLPNSPTRFPLVSRSASDISPSPIVPAAASISAAGSSLPSFREPGRPVDVSLKTKDWFIQNVLAESSSSSSAPLPTTSTPQTLSEMLDREPPSNYGAKVPVWTHIGPGNRGFALLQRAGWEEGSALGASSSKSTEVALRVQHTERGLTTQEHPKEIIDLTGDDEDEQYQVQESNDGGSMSDDSSDQEPVVPKEQPVHARLPYPSDYASHGTALLVPLPAFLKPDKHGIGLDSQKERRQMRLRNTEQALGAGLKPGVQRHSKITQETRRRQQEVGRGARGYARTSRKESETRQDMMRYMNT